MISRSAATTSGWDWRSGFPGIIGLLPMAAPPYKMDFSMLSSVIDACQPASWKFGGFGVRFAAPGPSPFPARPWHAEHRDEKISFALARASALTGADAADDADSADLSDFFPLHPVSRPKVSAELTMRALRFLCTSSRIGRRIGSLECNAPARRLPRNEVLRT